MIELQGLLVTSLPVPTSVQRPTPSESVKYGSWRRMPPRQHIPVFIKRLHFPGRSKTMHDQEWDAWRRRNLEVLRSRIEQLRGLPIACALQSYGYRLEEDPCAVVRRTHGQNILQYALGPPELDEPTKVSLLLDVALAIKFLHEQSPPVVHGGIHPTEILIDDQGHAILLDFGLNDIVARLESPPACAPSTRSAPWGGYYAPEVSKKKLPPTPATDVFAFAGVILAVMSKLHPHFDFPYPEAAHIMKGKPRRENHPALPADHQLWPVMEAMWDLDMTKRPVMPRVAQSLEALLINLRSQSALVPEVVMRSVSSSPEISNLQLEEIPQHILHTVPIQNCLSECPIALSCLPDPLKTDHVPEFEGELEIINPDIAQGGFSQVAQYRWRQSSSSIVTVAVKILKIKFVKGGNDDRKQELERFRREYWLWSKLEHQHILPLYGFRFEPAGPSLISPWCEHGDLFNVLNKHKEMDLFTRLSIAVQVGKGLEYLHTRVPPIAHGDIKPGNVLIHTGFRALIGDFGLSRVVEEFPIDNTTEWNCGTVRYRAPELWLYQKPSLEGDVYAYGCVVLKCCSFLDPFPKKNAEPDIRAAVFACCEVSPAQDHGLEETNAFYRIMCWCCQAYTGDRALIADAVAQLEMELNRINSSGNS